ncbi:hypothetical protein [Nocardia sp. NPDC019304]|uniref:hypothetical protein n=1 Tax=unclassified Nocardia TaxID=2637762 RepID=UPI0033DDB151
MSDAETGIARRAVSVPVSNAASAQRVTVTDFTARRGHITRFGVIIGEFAFPPVSGARDSSVRISASLPAKIRPTMIRARTSTGPSERGWPDRRLFAPEPLG